MSSSVPPNEPNPAELLTDLLTRLTTLRTTALSPNTIINVATPTEAASARALAIPPSNPQPLLSTITSMLSIMAHSADMASPSFFGFIPSPVHSSSTIGHMLSTLFNTHAGSWYQSSGASAVEDALLKWLAAQVGLPAATAGGVFVSGGSHANLTAMVAARDARLGWEERGKAVVYVGGQTHSSVQKGLGVAGFHVRQTRRVECDGEYRMRVERLREAVREDRERGLVPFMVVATCGFTNTGGVDPLGEIADVAEEEGLWMHVDGAYGASVVLSGRNKHLAEGLARADSLSWDAHKWLFQTYGCGMVLVRDVRHLVQSFAVNASYIQDADETTETAPNFWNRGIELTRPVRAMKLWFTLQTLGIDEIGRYIDHGIDLAETAQKTIEGLENWKIVTPARLAIVNFSYVVWSSTPDGERVEDVPKSDTVNLEVSKRAIARNVAAPLSTRLDGRLNLRMCTISPLLKTEDLIGIVHALDSLAKEVAAELGQWGEDRL